MSTNPEVQAWLAGAPARRQEPARPDSRTEILARLAPGIDDHASAAAATSTQAGDGLDNSGHGLDCDGETEQLLICDDDVFDWDDTR